jgi:uncharacterized protein (TIGR03437 family)
MKTKTTLLVVLLLGACAWQSSAQPAYDSSGDGALSGAYYMRQVFYFISDDAGDLGRAMNVQGEITFSGTGTYTFTGSVLDSESGSATPVTVTNETGTYAISASGEGIISAVNPDFPSDTIIGLVAHGVFIGSSTENGNGYNDMFIAAPITSTPATNATLSGGYSVAYFDPTYAGPTGAPGGDALLTFSAGGSGNIGTVNVTGYTGTNTSTSTQTLSGVTYSFNNGGAQINWGGSSSSTALIGGSEVLYITPDGNFVFGGSANGFDMFAGVRAATSAPSNYNGLYYQAGLDLDDSTASSGYTLLDSYFGAVTVLPCSTAPTSCPSGATNYAIGHQRVNSLLIYGGSSDFTYYDSYMVNGDGTSNDSTFGQDYVSSADGTIRIGYGIGPFMGLNVAFQGGPVISASGSVYLDPIGVGNAASSSPFTAFISPGEFLTLVGTGLAPTTNAVGPPFSNTLNGVQVFINQVAAPVYYVSPTQLEVVVPYITTPASVAQIQVVNSAGTSNVVTVFTGLTSVGVFGRNSLGSDPVGDAAALHPDNSVITETSPAQIGETVAVYLSGMGAVSPSVPDGSLAPGATAGTTPANTTATPTIYLTDQDGNLGTPTVTFSGLAPGLTGLYQIDFTIPTGMVAGDASLEVVGPDSDTLEALLPLSSTTYPAARPKSGNRRPHLRRHRLPVSQLRFGASSRPSTPTP